MAESESVGCGCGGVLLLVAVVAFFIFRSLPDEKKTEVVQSLQHVAQNVAKKTEELTRDPQEPFVEPDYDPPIGITFRAGIIVSNVLEVHSTTGEKQLMCTLNYVHNNEKSRISFALPPNGTTSPDSWLNFEAGDTGFIEVEGYNKKAYFERLEDGKYRTWFE